MAVYIDRGRRSGAEVTALVVNYHVVEFELDFRTAELRGVCRRCSLTHLVGTPDDGFSPGYELINAYTEPCPARYDPD